MIKIKNTNMHVTCTPEAQIFVRFALRRAVFELRPYFFSEKCTTELPQMTLTCSRSNIPTYMTHTPPWSKFSSYIKYVVITCTFYMSETLCQRRTVWCKICLSTKILTGYRSISRILYYSGHSNKMPIEFSLWLLVPGILWYFMSVSHSVI